jgi:phosphoribosylaminoimidazolecarboxamide formyltransferase / IMP cyclohydrolase
MKRVFTMSFIQTAFFSVYDKTHLDTFAGALVQRFGVRLVATGGTRRFLRSAGLEVQDLSEVTGFDDLLGGRVKSLHPEVFASILARQDDATDMGQLGRLPAFQLVGVNLYPFEAGYQQPWQERPDLVELIDIGGSALIRAAAKNHRHVAVVTSHAQYEGVLEGLVAQNGSLSLTQRQDLAKQAFARSRDYDALIHDWLEEELSKDSESSAGEMAWPSKKTLSLRLLQPMRYGENPHQPAALYESTEASASPITESDTLLHGKALSYNNVLDLEAAWSLACEFPDEVACAIVKHTQPCGVAVGSSAQEAYQKALDCDPLSAFGGIVAFNHPIDAKTAEQLKALFLEVIVAPGFDEAALNLLTEKKNLRLLQRQQKALTPEALPTQRNDALWFRQVSPTRYLAQWSLYQASEKLLSQELKVVTKAKPTEAQLKDMAFAWRVAKHLKSNAIVIAKDGQTLGLCGGSTSRVGAVEQSITQACENATGAVLASDGFFPAVDNIQVAAQNRIAAIIQPGGSIKDPEVIAACDQYGIAMVTTGVREFKH